jgi:peptidyl-dipeptidase A
VALMNKGAGELGFDDSGALWRSKYDMPPEAYSAEVERLWQQVRPLYLSLHAYVRRRLVEKYGADVVPPDGLIPAHLLGNPWAQEWGNIYPIVAPKDEPKTFDVTELLQAKHMDARGMVRTGERFFTSLGFAPLPETFWQRSLFTKPADRDVVCHASAWSIDNKDDVRLKMCIQVRGDDFTTVHHELGHNFYQLAYNSQPYLFRDSANDAFHEAIGDTIALSVTPAYLKEIGLLDALPSADSDIGLLLRQALDKIAFLPFGLIIDEWRWRVFAGDITPAHYNAAWWELRNRYQGVGAPVPRSEKDFDPGAKYHVPANYPYTRYFLARILQFQFHRALCEAAGQTGPLHRCSIYGSKEAGERLRRTLQMGASRPWPDALEALTGGRRMDATALTDYFAPLQRWLDEQNTGQKIGW